MKRSSRLSATLHVLVHLAQRPDQAFTSDQLARWWNTNPVVVRRTLAPLREAGLIRSEAGHGGGWRLGRPAAAISLETIYDLVSASLPGQATTPESPGCPVEQAVNDALRDGYREAEALLRARLAQVSLADIANDVAAHLPAGATLPGDPHHVHA